MKKSITFFIIFAVSNVFAQANNTADGQGISDDLIEFVSVDNMPRPIPKSELEKIQKKSSAKAPDGFSSLEESPEAVRGFFNNVNTAKIQIANQPPGNVQQEGILSAPEARKDMSTLNLTFEPATFNRGELIAAAPSGTLINNAWTGVERFFQIVGVGTVKLTEFDLGATNGKFYMLKDAVNTRVKGKRAISKVFTDGNNLLVEEIVWVHGKKLYSLTFGPDLIPTDGIRSKSKADPKISALSLAQEL